MNDYSAHIETNFTKFLIIEDKNERSSIGEMMANKKNDEIHHSYIVT